MPCSRPVRSICCMSLMRSVFSFGSMTLVSRLLGFVRDVVFARWFGAGPAMDAFVFAFKIPNFLRRLFAEGSFSLAFVPVLNEYREKHDHAALKSLIDATTGSLLAVLLVVTGLGVLGASWVVRLFAPGFVDDPHTFVLATDMLRITFPYLLLVALTALSGGILNTLGRFALPAVTPALLNVALITAAVAFSPLFEEPVKALAWGVLAGGVLQLAVQVPALARHNVLPLPRPGFAHDGVRRIMKLMVPTLFGSSVARSACCSTCFLPRCWPPARSPGCTTATASWNFRSACSAWPCRWSSCPRCRRCTPATVAQNTAPPSTGRSAGACSSPCRPQSGSPCWPNRWSSPCFATARFPATMPAWPPSHFWPTASACRPSPASRCWRRPISRARTPKRPSRRPSSPCASTWCSTSSLSLPLPCGWPAGALPTAFSPGWPPTRARTPGWRWPPAPRAGSTPRCCGAACAAKNSPRACPGTALPRWPPPALPWQRCCTGLHPTLPAGQSRAACGASARPGCSSAPARSSMPPSCWRWACARKAWSSRTYHIRPVKLHRNEGFLADAWFGAFATRSGAFFRLTPWFWLKARFCWRKIR